MEFLMMCITIIRWRKLQPHFKIYVCNYKLFSIAMNCQRCKGLIQSGSLCQDCKNVLLPYYENSNDWQQAFEMEALQRSFRQRNVVEPDINELSY